MYKNKIDLHMHTSSSFDGNYSAAQMCESAIKNGLATIAFTEHFEVDFYERHNLEFRQKSSYEDIISAIEKFSYEIRILRGI